MAHRYAASLESTMACECHACKSRRVDEFLTIIDAGLSEGPLFTYDEVHAFDAAFSMSDARQRLDNNDDEG